MSEPTTPVALARSLKGQRVTATLTNGSRVNGTLEGCGSHGLTILSGIGGPRRFGYGDIDDLCPEEPTP